MALNEIFSALIKDFAKSQQITTENESTQFEHFVNFTIISDVYGEEFNPIDISTGNHEFGLDGIAIVANGMLIEDSDQVDELVDRNKFLDVDFIFTQAKTGSSFDGGDMMKTMLAVDDFFGPLQLLKGERAKSRHFLKNYIYSKAPFFRRGKPRVSTFYATTGSWKDDQTLITIIEQQKRTLTDKGLFGNVLFLPIDGERLQSLYYRTQNAVRQQIIFPKSVAMPKIKDVKEAHIGVLPVSEYLKLIVDESGTLRKQIFFDNMRDFMQDTATNKEISETLASDRSGEFPLRNNGITIVARKLERVGEQFDIEDYQVVNGCQTSHVIFNNKDKVPGDVVVPVKIIVTEEDDVVSKVIRGSNYSNEFDKSQLWATEPFHKDLEVYFASLEGERLLHYERRKGQYSSGVGVEKVRIVTPIALLKSAASMFLERAHDVTKYYTKLEPEVGKNIFVQGHNPVAYQAAAYTLFRLEGLFRSKAILSTYKPLRHHLLMGFKMSFLPQSINLGDRSLSKDFEPMLATLEDPTKSAAQFNKLAEEADKLLKRQGTETFQQLAKQTSLRDRMRDFAREIAKQSE